MNDNLGKRAELKIKDWLNRPESGYSFDRIPDQMHGFSGSRNICDFTLFKSPYMYYIESKSTWAERFDWNMITEHQRKNLLKKSKIDNVFGVVIVLFATQRRAFVFQIEDIQKEMDEKRMSVNIDRIKNWKIPYVEIRTEPNPRKELPDYVGEIEEYMLDLNQESEDET